MPLTNQIDWRFTLLSSDSFHIHFRQKNHLIISMLYWYLLNHISLTSKKAKYIHIWTYTTGQENVPFLFIAIQKNSSFTIRIFVKVLWEENNFLKDCYLNVFFRIQKKCCVPAQKIFQTNIWSICLKKTSLFCY